LRPRIVLPNREETTEDKRAAVAGAGVGIMAPVPPIEMDSEPGPTAKDKLECSKREFPNMLFERGLVLERVLSSMALAAGLVVL